MRKIIIFICALLVSVSCCNFTSDQQAVVTFTDGTTKVYKIVWYRNTSPDTFALWTINNEQIYITKVKEIYIKPIVNHKTQY